MAADTSDFDRSTASISTAHYSGGLFVGSYASGRVDVTFATAGRPTLVGMPDREIEIPVGSPVFDHLLAAATAGAVTYLTRDGRRVAAVLPADIADSILREPPGEPDDEDGDDRFAQPWGGGRPTLDDLRRQQGVRPLDDPAGLRGAGMADFEQFFTAAMSSRLDERGDEVSDR